jgi:methyl-accepting chemotaxis protein
MGNKRFLSIRMKLLLPLVLIFALLFAVVFLASNLFLGDTIAGLFEEDLTNALEVTQLCINGDDLQGLTASPNPMNDARYDAVFDCLDGTSYFLPDIVLTTYYLDSSDTLRYGVDGLGEYEFGQALSEDELVYFEEPMRNGYTDFAFETEPYEDFDEEDNSVYYYSGYAPITNSQGITVGGLMADMQAGETLTFIADMQFLLVFLFALAFLGLALVIFILTGQVTRSLKDLNTATANIAEGDYEKVELKGGLFDDEVRSLARVFNDMAEKVYKREVKLVENAQKMKIFIDEDRKAAELAEIVESDFFRELQERKLKLKSSTLGVATAVPEVNLASA